MSFEGRPQQNIILFDDAGNPVAVVQDGSIYRLAVDVKGTVSVGAPADYVAQVIEFLKDGSSEDMVVDGDPTPVDFVLNADPTQDIVLTEVRLVMTSLSIGWGNFGKGGGLLTNGILIDGVLNNGSPVTLFELFRNEDIVRMPSAGGGGFVAEFLASNDDLIAASLYFSGNDRLVAGSGDFLRARVRDDLSSGIRGISYLTTTAYGYKETP